ncbi:MAG: Chromate resistance protein ChrB [Rhodospirillales bacterium]|nr:Chromate resistance protein ChrB [Rhodospirillales bacterium]
MNDLSQLNHQTADASAPWLLLIHQVPPKPDYLRVKVGRALQAAGAIAIKNSVYALPNRSDARRAFQLLRHEIVVAGGDATIAAASWLDGLDDRALRDMFRASADAGYAELRKRVDELARDLPQPDQPQPAATKRIATALARARVQAAALAATDFFNSPGGAALEAAIAHAEASIRAPAGTARLAPAPRRGTVWVTRADVHVDRIASAWLIRRFADQEARFKFVPPRGYRPQPGEIRFDMFEAEYGHEGDRCTFEVLARRFAPEDPAVGAIAEMVHDLDIEDARYRRAETPGVAALLAGIVAGTGDDDERIARGHGLFDGLHAALGTATATQPKQRRTK